MANIRAKDITDLTTWDIKELRKLKITIKNRMSSLESFRKDVKELPDTHPLQGMELGDCKNLLESVLKAERDLAKA
jgi:hypothetical protein